MTTGLIRVMKQLIKEYLLQEDIDQLQLEMEKILQFDHPRIGKVYEVFHDENNYYLISEYGTAD